MAQIPRTVPRRTRSGGRGRADRQGHRHGPGGAITDLLDLPPQVRSGLVPAPIGNPGPTEAEKQAFLRLNRAGGTRKALKAAKGARAAR